MKTTTNPAAKTVRVLSWCAADKGVSGGYCNRCGYKSHRPILSAEVDANARANRKAQLAAS